MSEAARVAATVVRIPPAWYGRPAIRAANSALRSPAKTRCAWESTNPGSTARPSASTTESAAGACPAGPVQATAPSSMTSAASVIAAKPPAIVGNQFPDLRDQRAAWDCHRTSLPHPYGAVCAQVVEAAEGAFKRVGEPLAVTGGQQVKHQAGERRLDQRRLAFGVLGLDAVSDQAVGDVLAPERDLLRTHITGQTADRGVQRGGFETQSHQRQVLRAAVDPPPPAPLQLRRGQVRYLPPPPRFDSSLNLSGPPQGGDHQFVLAAEVMHQRVDRHTQCAGHWPQ